jgi:hypothetical protein
MVTAILSPHLDDAVLSCWHVLAERGEVVVINVFAGVPARMSEPAWWDQLTGASDSRQRVRERVKEDREALALVGRESLNLGFLDEQYREAEHPLAPLAAQIESRLVHGAHVYAPAALGGHVDHALVRAAALQLRHAGFGVSLYADLPHATIHGWPAWVTGTGTTASPDLAAGAWYRTLAQTGISPAAMHLEVHQLDAHSHARKLKAVHSYVSQLTGLVELGGRALTDRETLGYELIWKLPTARRPSLAPASRHVERHL